MLSLDKLLKTIAIIKNIWWTIINKWFFY